jgi:hypothetical protein
MNKLLLSFLLAAGAAPAQEAAEDPPVQALPGWGIEEAVIAAFVQGANRGALAVAGVAAERASDPDVKAFAEHLRMERMDLGGAFDALTSMRQFPEALPQDPEQFQNQGEEAARMLAGKDGAEADRAFLDVVEDASRRLVERIDGHTQHATEPRLQNYLTALRKAAQRDQDIAEELKNR